VQFSYYKTTNCATPCGAMHCYLQRGAVMPFRGLFWCGFCGLINTPITIYF